MVRWLDNIGGFMKKLDIMPRYRYALVKQLSLNGIYGKNGGVARGAIFFANNMGPLKVGTSFFFGNNHFDPDYCLTSTVRNVKMMQDHTEIITNNSLYCLYDNKGTVFFNTRNLDICIADADARFYNETHWIELGEL